MKTHFPVVMMLVALFAFACGSSDSDTNGENDAQNVSDTANEQDTVQGGENEHPKWPGVFWDTFWPSEGETAVYQAMTIASEQADVTARVERDVAWMGESWTRIVAGDLEPGKDGVAIYLDDSNPWEVRVRGVDTYSSEYADGAAISEYFETPIVLPLAPEANTPTHIETTLKSTMYGEEMDIGVVYDLVIESYDAEVEVPYGTLTGCIVMKATITGDLGGPDGFEVEVVAHPEQRIVKWTDSPGFLMLELKEGWK